MSDEYAGLPCYLMDIDGTLANGSHRLHHLEKQPKDWDAYFATMADDAPHPHMIQLCDRLAHFAAVLYVTGRPAEYREITIEWLRRHGLYSGRDTILVGQRGLYMRPSKNFIDDSVLKIQLLDQIRKDGFAPIMAFDDRTRVVKAWRAAGIPCAQVAEGDF